MISHRRSSEDQELFDEIKEMISQQTPVYSTSDGQTVMEESKFFSSHHSQSIALESSSADHSIDGTLAHHYSLPKMSFSQLSELSCSQLDSTALDLLNPTLVDERLG